MAGDVQTQVLSKILDLTAERQRVLAHNLANINTPGFHRMDLDFQADLAEALREGPQALVTFTPVAKEDPNAEARADGNTVQLETEVSEMNKNSMLYQMTLHAMTVHMSILRTAVTGK